MNCVCVRRPEKQKQKLRNQAKDDDTMNSLKSRCHRIEWAFLWTRKWMNSLRPIMWQFNEFSITIIFLVLLFLYASSMDRCVNVSPNFTFFIPLIIKNANVFECACVTVQWIINMQLENWKFQTWTYSCTHARTLNCVLFIIICAHNSLIHKNWITFIIMKWRKRNERKKRRSNEIQTICTVNKSFCTFSHKGADTSAIHLRQWRQKNLINFMSATVRARARAREMGFILCFWFAHILRLQNEQFGWNDVMVCVHQWDGVW